MYIYSSLNLSYMNNTKFALVLKIDTCVRDIFVLCRRYFSFLDLSNILYSLYKKAASQPHKYYKTERDTIRTKGKIMDAIEKEFESRKDEIQKEMLSLFKVNMKITDWDVPEADDNKAAKILVQIMQESLDKIKLDVEAGEYDYY